MSRSTKLVAMVDDDPAVLDAIKILLEYDGWRIAIHRTGDSLLADIHTHMPDCVILDPNLGFGITAVDVARRLAYYGVPIIGLTARPNSPKSIEIERLGVHTMLVKPVRADELIQHIEAILYSAIR